MVCNNLRAERAHLDHLDAEAERERESGQDEDPAEHEDDACQESFLKSL